ELRVGVGADVEQPGIRELAVVAWAAVRGEPQVVRMLGLDGAGPVHAHEHLERAEGGALRGERLDQRQRLGAALAPDHPVAGADDAAEIDCRLHSRMLTSPPSRTDRESFMLDA